MTHSKIITAAKYWPNWPESERCYVASQFFQQFVNWGFFVHKVRILRVELYTVSSIQMMDPDKVLLKFSIVLGSII